MGGLRIPAPSVATLRELPRDALRAALSTRIPELPADPRPVTEVAQPVRRLLAAWSRPLPAGTTLERPPPRLPPGYVRQIEGVGDIFFRDTGSPSHAPQGTIVLMHGWMVPTDAHWFRTFELLEALGWRVVAIDARGHGRGLRPGTPFRLLDCASDTAALIRHLDCAPVIVVGYSMGGLLAQLLARDHPELLAGAIFSATSAELRTNPLMRLLWSGMGVFQLYLRLAPRWSWELFVRTAANANPETTDWIVGELRRGAAWDIAEAGREIGRFDSRDWIGRLDVPAVVLVTARDVLVPPSRQRELAERMGAPQVAIDSDHLAPAATPEEFNRALVEALAALQEQRLGEVGIDAA
jgi:3-oxoadipate enol-lactonase